MRLHLGIAIQGKVGSEVIVLLPTDDQLLAVAGRFRQGLPLTLSASRPLARPVEDEPCCFLPHSFTGSRGGEIDAPSHSIWTWGARLELAGIGVDWSDRFFNKGRHGWLQTKSSATASDTACAMSPLQSAADCDLVSLRTPTSLRLSTCLSKMCGCVAETGANPQTIGLRRCPPSTTAGNSGYLTRSGHYRRWRSYIFVVQHQASSSVQARGLPLPPLLKHFGQIFKSTWSLSRKNYRLGVNHYSLKAYFMFV